jgi:hypothetical protein
LINWKKNQNRVGPTPSVSQSERRRPGRVERLRTMEAAALPAPTASLPPFPPAVPTATPPSSTASCGFKRSAPPKELVHSSSSVHTSPLLHLTSTPSSAQATPLSRSTVLKRRFYLEPADVKRPRSHPTPCAISTESALSMAAISGHRPPSISPPRGPHRCPDPLRLASRRR